MLKDEVTSVQNDLLVYENLLLNAFLFSVRSSINPSSLIKLGAKLCLTKIIKCNFNNYFIVNFSLILFGNKQFKSF